MEPYNWLVVIYIYIYIYIYIKRKLAYYELSCLGLVVVIVYDTLVYVSLYKA